MNCGLKLWNAGDRNRYIGGVVKHLNHSTVELPAQAVTMFRTKSKSQEKQWVSFNWLTN